MLETSHLARKYTLIFTFRKCTFQYLTPLILLMSAFFCKLVAFFVPESTFTQSNSVRAGLEIFRFLFSVFGRQKVTVNEKMTFADSVSGIQPTDCSKLAQNKKNDNDVTIFRNDVIVNFFYVVLFLLSG